ncbi:MAG TPA: histidine kinase [Trebonia sp.]|jgi:signal transduction histidine kinase
MARATVKAIDAEGSARVGAVALRAETSPGQTPDGPAVSHLPGPVRASDHFCGWLATIAVVTILAVGAWILSAGLPSGVAGAGSLALLGLAATLSVVALSPRIRHPRLTVPALVGVGLCGAGLDWQVDGPGFIASYVSLMGLGLRVPRRIAILAGIPVVAAISVEETYQSAKPASTVLAVISASGLLFMTAAFAAFSLDRRQHAEALLAEEATTSQARQAAAALAERSRLARDLHDVLAHNLSALAVQLEATRLMVITKGAGENIVDQVAAARRLACIGLLESRRVVLLLREGEVPDAASLPELVSEISALLGIPVALQSHGVPCHLGPGAGAALYRVVQEALTNVVKHAGRGAEVTVRLDWAPDGVEASVTDRGGDGVDSDLPSSGSGLSGMAERVSLIGGHLRAGPAGDGFAVHLWLPSCPGELGQAP